jgi:hypothetical protein
LIARLDRIRIPSQNSTSTLEIRRSAKPSEPPEVSGFHVYSSVSQESGQKRISTLMICTAPSKDAGKRMLFQDDACWFFDPRAKRPVRVSPAQMWSQPMAFDSPNWRLAEDFSAAPAGREAILCADGITRSCLVIDFAPVTKPVSAPARMRYWLDESGRYRKIEHFTESGRLFKTIDNIRYERVLDSERAVGMRIRAGAESAEVSISDVLARTSPRSWFDPDGLPLITP